MSPEIKCPSNLSAEMLRSPIPLTFNNWLTDSTTRYPTPDLDIAGKILSLYFAYLAKKQMIEHEQSLLICLKRPRFWVA